MTEIIAVVVVSVAALGLRAWKYHSLGLAHFDEGVYANSAFVFLSKFFGPGLDPWQKLFSPPGFFSLVGVAYRIAGGPSDLAPIGINIAVGGAMPVLVYWMGRRWLGQAAGIFAAVLVASGEFEIAYSRTGLTDTLFSFLFLLSLAVIAVCLESGRWTHGIAAGLAVGATWNVKYHGWLPAGIALMVIAVRIVVSGEERARAKHLFMLWGLIALTALLCFAPWLAFVELRLGGYREVEEFHRRFADFHWLANAIRQEQMQLYFEGWLSRIAASVALIAAACVGAGPIAGKAAWRTSWLVLLLASGFVIGGAGTLLVLSLLGLGFVWRKRGYLGPMLACTFVVFAILTPMYRPYARLLLPWMATAQLLAGLAIAEIVLRDLAAGIRGAEMRPRMTMAVVAGTAGILALCVLGWGLRRNTGSAWSDRTRDRSVAREIMSSVPMESVVFVVGEPQICFYFRQAGYQAFCVHRLGLNGIAQDPLLYVTAQPVFIVGGKYARDEPSWLKIQTYAPDRFVEVAKFGLQPGDIRLLDDLPPGEVAEFEKAPDSRYELELLRLNRGQSQRQ